MLACITTAAVLGLEGRLVQVEVDIAHQGLPNFFLVGLPTDAVKEARERVRTAIKNSGLVVKIGQFENEKISEYFIFKFSN